MSDVTLQVRINGGSAQTGAVSAAVGDTVQLTAANKAGWNVAGVRWELYDFPPDMTVPAGWSTASDGSYYFLGSADPPSYTVTHWGKILPRVTAVHETDERTAIDVPSASGLRDMMVREGSQFGGTRLKWAKHHKENLRQLDTAAASVPLNGVLVRASGDTTGGTDRAAVNAITSAGGTAMLVSAHEYFDDGTPIVFASGARVVTTDERPAFWLKGSAATASMNALPGCINQSGAALTMNLPPAANWAEQTTVCEVTAAATVTIDPYSTETIGAKTTQDIGGSGDRLAVMSRGTPVLVPVRGGAASDPRVYTDQLFGVSGPLFMSPGPIATTARELDNYNQYIGDLRVADGFAKGTAIVYLSLDGVNLVDQQIFGSTNATNFLYWRTAFNVIGARWQALSTDPTKSLVFELVNGGAFFQVAAGASSSTIYLSASNAGIHALEISGHGNWIARSGAGRTHSIRPGVGTIYDIDWQTASSSGLEQKRHITGTTNNATPTNITLIAAAFIPDNQTIRVKCECVAYHATNAAGYTLAATFRKVGGTLTQVGTTTQTSVHEDTAGMDATLAASSGDIIATVTGVAATAIRWEFYPLAVFGQA